MAALVPIVFLVIVLDISDNSDSMRSSIVGGNESKGPQDGQDLEEHVEEDMWLSHLGLTLGSLVVVSLSLKCLWGTQKGSRVKRVT